MLRSVAPRAKSNAVVDYYPQLRRAGPRYQVVYVQFLAASALLARASVSLQYLLSATWQPPRCCARPHSPASPAAQVRATAERVCPEAKRKRAAVPARLRVDDSTQTCPEKISAYGWFRPGLRTDAQQAYVVGELFKGGIDLAAPQHGENGAPQSSACRRLYPHLVSKPGAWTLLAMHTSKERLKDRPDLSEYFPGTVHNEGGIT